MEKFTEKRNFGIPATILCLLAYLIGYELANSFSGGLLVAVLFAVIVFGFQFDDRVRNAVKQSYIVAVLINLIYFCFTLLEYVIELVTPQEFNAGYAYNSNIKDLADTYDLNAFQNILVYILKYGKSILEVAVVVIFVIFIIQALQGKALKLNFVNKLTGDAPVFQGRPMYQQPMNPVQPMNPAQPMNPVQPAASGIVCQNCGKVNVPGAGFCAGCGAKLN